MSEYLTRMRALEKDYQDRSGITDRRRYKFQYTHIHPFPLMAFGYNPGGDPTANNHLELSTSHYQNWEHDLVGFRQDSRYNSALPWFAVLAACLGTADEKAVSMVPYLNVIFRRSIGTDKLREQWKAERKKERDYIEEVKPVVTQVLQLVSPRYLVLVKDAFRVFQKHYLGGVEAIPCDPEVWEDHRGTPCQILKLHQATLLPTGNHVDIAEIGHPSTFGRKPAWPDAAKGAAVFFRERGLLDFVSSIPPHPRQGGAD